MSDAVVWLKNLCGYKKGLEVAQAYAERFDKDDHKIRLILGDLAGYCNVTHTSFVANDPYQTAFNEGARDVFLHISEMCNLTSDDIRKLTEGMKNVDEEKY